MAENHAKVAERKRVLRGFAVFWEQHGRAPTVRELGRFLGYPSELGAQKAMKRLQLDGMILTRKRVLEKADRVSALGRRWLENDD